MASKAKKPSRPKKPKTKAKPAPQPIIVPGAWGATYSEAVADHICDLLCNGKTLNAICKRDPSLPSERTIRRWAMDPNHPFSPKYTRAREIGYIKMGDDLIDLTDTVSEESGAVAKVRVQLDARIWYLSKALPKVFGDKIAQEITGKDGEPFYKKESPLETARWIAWILNRGTRELDAVGEEAAGEPAGPIKPYRRPG